MIAEVSGSGVHLMHCIIWIFMKVSSSHLPVYQNWKKYLIYRIKLLHSQNTTEHSYFFLIIIRLETVTLRPNAYAQQKFKCYFILLLLINRQQNTLIILIIFFFDKQKTQMVLWRKYYLGFMSYNFFLIDWIDSKTGK